MYYIHKSFQISCQWTPKSCVGEQRLDKYSLYQLRDNDFSSSNIDKNNVIKTCTIKSKTTIKAKDMFT